MKLEGLAMRNEGNTPDCPLHGLILAGGRSSRMGRDKALLHMDGQTLLERLVAGMLGLMDSVTIAAGTTERVQQYREALAGCRKELESGRVRFVLDAYPGDGPLAGLHAGLSVLPPGYVFVMACDMPEVSPSLLARMREAARERDGEADVIHVSGQPFHALYHTRAAAAVAESLVQRDYRVMRLLDRLRTIRLAFTAESTGAVAESTADGGTLCNLNTPEDYEQYLDRMRRDER
ncbi:molybdenum cofactor guanylyltransferase [Paenibacillus sp. PL2-23]|uniref:molybdenum cofactor guanylyltransferase n=1 Tax=Paenibacillus sp. PL2-23 TaxID=2100729 RepID=UPI0030F6CFB4